MTRSTNMEHVEVLWAMLRKCVNERLARKSADREAAALAAAIEALKSAPQPPAEAPPSAPVGVEGVRREIQNALRELDVVMTAEDNTSDAVGCAELALQRALETLAQPPAAGVGEEIMVNAAHDVYTLPLQPSGLSSGPRFVVHVPAPEQPAAHPAITHCDNCGCDWLDNGLNPIGCPYCKQNAWRAAYVAERATRYREGGVKIEQARIHAETDAARIAALAAQPGGSDNDR